MTILVIGSTNQDLFIQLPYLPKTGETLLGSGLFKSFGGKGANQAVAIARAGGDTAFITAVGNDAVGKEALSFLNQESIDTRHSLIKSNTTATAMIWVSEQGDNVIAIDPGANYNLTTNDVAACEAHIASCALLVLQMEIPIESVGHAIGLANKHQTPILLNAAPAHQLARELIPMVDLLVVNETEAGQLASLPANTHPRKLYKTLKSQGYQQVIITLGAQGAYTEIDNETYWQKAYPASVVDTTGAGDTFVGYLAKHLGDKASLRDALDHASRAASLAVAKAGAMASVPFSPA